MKKNLWLMILILAGCLFTASFLPVFAANLSNAFDQNTLNAVAGPNYNTGTDIYQIIGLIVQALLGLLGVVFIMLIVYGGIIWMTAEGEETKIEKAQTIIRSAIIGLVIVIAAYAISYFVINALNKSVLGK